VLFSPHSNWLRVTDRNSRPELSLRAMRSNKQKARNEGTPLRAAIASSRLSWLRGVTCFSGLALHIGCLQLDYGPTLAQSSSFDCAIAIDCAALLLISSLACVELLDTATNHPV
jgi:hypothetical protein